jgi:uncharacterized cupredoxin-like copper-binding protein
MKSHRSAARVTAAVAVFVLFSVLAVPALGARAHATSTTVTVTETEFHFKLSKTSVPHGAVTFVIVNKGKLAHDFKIAGKKTPLLAPGKTTRLTVTLKAGRLPYICTVAGHAAAGMKGTLIVK